MHKVNIANYVVFDIANRFNLDENRDMDAELVEMVANAWHKKHFVSGAKEPECFRSDTVKPSFWI